MNLRHTSLVAWQRADDLFIKLHKLTIHSLVSFERFSLALSWETPRTQSRQNIAEGFGPRKGGDRRISWTSLKHPLPRSRIAYTPPGGSVTSTTLSWKSSNQISIASVRR